jgi:hypothetical protein
MDLIASIKDKTLLLYIVSFKTLNFANSELVIGNLVEPIYIKSLCNSIKSGQLNTIVVYSRYKFNITMGIANRFTRDGEAIEGVNSMEDFIAFLYKNCEAYV